MERRHRPVMMAGDHSRGERGSESDVQRRSVAIAFGVVVTLALIVRGAVSVATFSSLSADPDAYRAIAETVRQSGVFGLTDASGNANPTAFRPPLYPLVLAVTSTHAVAIAALHVVLGVVTVAFSFASTHLLFRKIPSSIVAGLLVAIDPILLHQSTLVMTETLAVAIVSGIFLVWLASVQENFSVGRSAAIGGLMAAAFLCRPTFLVWAAMLIGVLIAHPFWHSRSKARWTPPVVVGTAVALAVGVWMTRNFVVLGHPVWATTHGGYTLLLANNPDVYDHLRSGRPLEDWNPQAFFAAYEHRYAGDPTTASFWQTDWSSAGPPTYPDDANEVNDDRYVGAAARATIAGDMAMFAWSCAYRCKSLWTPFPGRSATGSQTVSMAIGSFYLLVYALAIVGAFRFSRNARLVSWLAWTPIAAMAVTLTLVHAVYWSNVRMRAPAMPLIASLAAGGLVSPMTKRDEDVADG